jgi:hypothetical protein
MIGIASISVVVKNISLSLEIKYAPPFLFSEGERIMFA